MAEGARTAAPRARRTDLGPRLAAAERLENAGRLREAEALLAELCAAEPACFPAWLALGKVRSRQESWPGAQAALERALELQRDSLAAALALAFVLRGRKALSEAERVLKSFVERAPWSFAGQRELARLWKDAGRLKRAAEGFGRALELEPRSREARLERLALRLGLGEFPAAFEDAERLLDLGLASEKQVEFLCYPFGELGHAPWTRPRLRRVRAALEAYAPRPKERVWVQLYRLALALQFDNRNPDLGALPELSRLAKGRYAWMRWLIGSAYVRSYRWNEALRELLPALKARPNFMRAAFLAGEALVGRGAPEQAVALLEKLEAPSDESFGVWLSWMGELYLRLERHERALEYLDRAVGRGDGMPLAVCWRGAARLRLGQVEASVADFDAAVLRAPHDPEPYSWRGEALRLLGRHDEALRDLDRVLEIFPGDPAALINRALVHAERGREAALRADFRRLSRRSGARYLRWLPSPLPEDPAGMRTALLRINAAAGDRLRAGHHFFPSQWLLDRSEGAA